MTLSLDTAYRSFGGEVEASSTPTICRLPDSRRHQLSAIAPIASQIIAPRLVVSLGSTIVDNSEQMRGAHYHLLRGSGRPAGSINAEGGPTAPYRRQWLW